MKTTVLEAATGAEIDMMDPQNTTTTSESLEVVDMGIAESFSELRNNKAFDFWKSSEENLY